MAPRAYTSPSRSAQLVQTRDKLLDAARAMLVEGGLDALTLPRLAEAAGVSVPTVYRHFATMDDLLRAFLDWIRPRIGQTTERLFSPAERLPVLPAENYALYEQHAEVLRPLMESRAFNRIRVGSVRDRARSAAAVLRPCAPGRTASELEALAGAIYLFISPQVWRWLRETWGLEATEAAHASTWAIQVLLDALARPPTPARKPRGKPRRPR